MTVATRALLWAAVLCVMSTARAAVFPLPVDGDVVGDTQDVVAAQDDTLIDLARRYGLGYEEVVNANPGVDPWLPGAGTHVRMPLKRILPDTPREGIVVNLPEHRLYYYPPAKPGEARVVVTYPVSVGKMDWSTPLGLTKIQAKIKDRPGRRRSRSVGNTPNAAISCRRWCPQGPTIRSVCTRCASRSRAGAT